MPVTEFICPNGQKVGVEKMPEVMCTGTKMYVPAHSEGGGKER